MADRTLDTEPYGATPDQPLAPSATYGRFVAIGVLGSGGMGVVLSAYDPKLDRKVALKLLRPDARGGSVGERDRLRREAQAMAKLNHPNVVTLYETGQVGDREFLAMELVEGQTLRAWQEANRRPWREVLSMYTAAGRGLAAAHAAGLVHRDFKPENVLIGADGRPRVGDFGLAAARPGQVAGTPTYMAPEQRAGSEEIDARADQYSFCVALWEALHGAPPAADGPPAPAERSSPAWLAAALRRGLRPAPSDRWPSMDALLDELDRRGSRRRGVLVVSAATAVLGAAAVVLTVAASRRATAVDPCPEAGARLAGAWDAARKREVRAAFERTGLSYATQTADLVAGRLDADARRWIAANREACRATHVEGRQSDSMLDRRMECLDRWRGATAALTTLWVAEMAPPAVEGAAAAVDALPSISDCADTAALAERVARPRDPAARERIDGAQAAIDRANALRSVRRAKEALEAALAARDAAELTGFAPVRARALLLVGLAAQRQGDSATARPALLQAARIAGAVHEPAIAAEAMTMLIRVIGVDESRYAEAALLGEVVEILLLQAGDPVGLRSSFGLQLAVLHERQAKFADARGTLAEVERILPDGEAWTPRRRVELLIQQASVAEGSGDFAEARAIYQRLVPLVAELVGADHPQMGIVLNNQGLLLAQLSDYPGATEALERSLAIKAATAGEASPSYANALDNLATVLMITGRLDEAQRGYERVLAIREQAYGPDHERVAASLLNLGALLNRRGRHRQATPFHERALALAEKNFGREHTMTAEALENAAVAHDRLGEAERGRRLFEEALAIRRKVQGGEHPDTLTAMSLHAGVLARRGECGRAELLAGAALAGLEKAVGPEHASLAGPLEVLGRCNLSAGHAAEATPRLERALALLVKAGEPGRLPAVRFALARALWEPGGDRARARSLAEEAEKQLAAEDPDGLIAEVRAWRAGRGPE